jgi:hypothetical protein
MCANAPSRGKQLRLERLATERGEAGMKIGPPESSASLGLALLVSNDRDAIEQLVD